VLAVTNGVLDAEEDATDTYGALITAAESADDPVTEALAVTTLSDEEVYRTEFCGLNRGADRLRTANRPAGLVSDNKLTTG
jgi:bacterioferritin